MNLNWLSVYQAACRANLAYEQDPAKSEAGFSSLGQGLIWLGLYQKDSHQAVACIDTKGEGWLSISGTRFGTNWGDVLDDAMILPRSLGNGVHVTVGAFDGVEEMWDWANGLVDPSTVWNVCGHSLGAWRTRYTPVFLPANRIGMLHSFESPKGANAAYWEKYQQELAGMVSIVNGRDLFVSWPFMSYEWTHPQTPMVWLKSIGYQLLMPSMWPGGRLLSDHSMDLVEQRCKLIAGVGHGWDRQ